MKKRYLVLLIIAVALAAGAITAIILISRLDANLKELVQTEITEFDLAAAKDGYFVGKYATFPVSAEVGVTVKNHDIVKIDLINHTHGKGEEAEIIPSKVVEAQSLKVDSISGATYSSKVILKAIEDALLHAAA